jgi:long-subunit acyl-CoA synthetase (AMP-forming)
MAITSCDGTIPPAGPRGEADVMRGHLNRSTQPARCLARLAATGDVGVVDDDGHLRIVDRITT